MPLDSFASSCNTIPMYISMSTIEDFSYNPSVEERTRDAAQVIATGRQSWKTLKGRGEAVWPPNLEAALIEALGKYQPQSTRLLGRFPMRNKFISEYIFEVTGKRRTPKQVGSRLQQLRDTCRGKQIFHLISDRSRLVVDSDSRTASPSSQLSTPPPDVDYESHRREWPQFRRKFLHVDILTDSVPWSSPFPVINIVDQDSAPHRIRLTSLSAKPSSTYANMDNTVAFVSPWPLSPTTTFSVFFSGISAPIHTEAVQLLCHSSPCQGCGWVYKTTLIPAFWHMLCNSGDPNSYTIAQELVPVRRTSTDESYPEGGGTTLLITLVYRFEYPYTLSTSSAHPYSIQQCHATEVWPPSVNAEYAVQSFSSKVDASPMWGSDYHHTSSPVVPQPCHDQSSDLVDHCGTPRFSITQDSSSLCASQSIDCGFDSTDSSCNFSYISNTPTMISQPVHGRMTDYVPESARLTCRDTCPVGPLQSWPAVYGNPSDTRSFSPTS